MVLWIVIIGIILFFADIIFTGGKNVRKSPSELFSLIFGIGLVIWFIRWIFVK